VTDGEPFRRVVEDEVGRARFSMPAVVRGALATLSGTEDLAAHAAVEEAAGRRVAMHVLKGVLRSVFLIELVKTPKIETTKFEVRWASRLEERDPRHASYDDCCAALRSVMAELRIAVGDPSKRELLGLFERQHLLPYEIPLDYRERVVDGQMHNAANIGWIWGDELKRVMTLRSFLRGGDENPHAPFFVAAYDKIKVKTYLTDRVLTGSHKTNREKRWEVHPGSVHFALRRTCMGIEYTLVNQLCHFQGVPGDLRTRLDEANMLDPVEEPVRCPITMEELSFGELEREIGDPEHGKAQFQVGHLNPLKAVNDDPQSGHTAQNISWISSDGNRIQGSLSLQEVRQLVARIYNNYVRFGVGLGGNAG